MSPWRLASLLPLALVGSARAAPAVCLPGEETIVSAALDATLRVCLSGGGCWRVDLDTGRWTAGAAAIPPNPAAADLLPAEVDASGVKVCAADGTRCERVAIPGVTSGDVRAIANDARSLVAIVPADASGLRVLELPGGKPRYALRPWRAPMGLDGFGDVRFLGDALYVSRSERPITSTARLYRARTGRQLAYVGKRGAELDGPPPVQVEGSVYAFAGFAAQQLYLQDVATGKVTAAIDLGSRERDPDASLVFLAAMPDRRLLAVSGRPGARAVLLVEPQARRVVALPAPPPCP